MHVRTSTSLFNSKHTTKPTPSTSKPRLATLVATRIRQLWLRNRTKVLARSVCSRSPCSGSALAPRDRRNVATDWHCNRVSQNTMQEEPLDAMREDVARTWESASRRACSSPEKRRADCWSRARSTCAAVASSREFPSETIWGRYCTRLLSCSTRSPQVAEKSSVCRPSVVASPEGGRHFTIWVTSSSNPISSSVSASSMTKHEMTAGSI
mmetsp:Transcript_31943/g.32216  ORF Transcript_31943/g.32216 Transcript_31943/m.32216 type:complete len:210 (-) Transcript_31943:100-729(-)